jgi:hypothetical protein
MLDLNIVNINLKKNSFSSDFLFESYLPAMAPWFVGNGFLRNFVQLAIIENVAIIKRCFTKQSNCVTRVTELKKQKFDDWSVRSWLGTVKRE